MNFWLFLIPVISAFIGWLLHRIVAWHILRRYWPQKQQQLTKQIGIYVATHLPLDDIETKLADPMLIEKAMPYIDKHIDIFLNEKLQQEIPMLGMFIGNKTTDKIKEVFINQLKQLFPTIMAEMAGNLKETFNLQKRITDKINNPAIQKQITFQLSAQLNRLPFLGLIAGFAIGLINVLLIWLFI